MDHNNVNLTIFKAHFEATQKDFYAAYEPYKNIIKITKIYAN